MTGWAWLLIAGVFEIGMTTALKLEQQNQQFIWVFLACAIIGFECLAKAMRTIPLGLAYAIWTGIGAVGTVLVGALAFGERLKPAALALLAVVLAMIVGLKVVS